MVTRVFAGLQVHKKLGNDHLTSMYISWGTDLDPKGANSQVREASDLLINHSVVPDIGKRENDAFCGRILEKFARNYWKWFILGGVLSPSEQPVEASQLDESAAPSQASVLEPVDMEETL